MAASPSQQERTGDLLLNARRQPPGIPHVDNQGYAGATPQHASSLVHYMGRATGDDAAVMRGAQQLVRHLGGPSRPGMRPHMSAPGVKRSQRVARAVKRRP